MGDIGHRGDWAAHVVLAAESITVPRFLEQKLKAEAAKQGLTGRAADRYTYGAMNNNYYYYY